MGRGAWGWCCVRGHSASGAPALLNHEWEERLLYLRPVPDLQGAASEGRDPGRAGRSPARPCTPRSRLRPDLAVIIQNIHWYCTPRRAAIPEVILFTFYYQYTSGFWRRVARSYLFSQLPENTETQQPQQAYLFSLKQSNIITDCFTVQHQRWESRSFHSNFNSSSNVDAHCSCDLKSVDECRKSRLESELFKHSIEKKKYWNMIASL